MIQKNKIILAIIIMSTWFNYSSGKENNIKFKIPDVDSFNLKNNIKVFYYRDELPRFAISASIGFGKLNEKKDTAGMSDLIVKILNIGSTKNYFEKIESLGGKISINTSFETTSINIEILQRYSSIAADTIYDILKNPDFSDETITTAKNMLADEIKRKSDEPDFIALEKTREIIFGGDSYGAAPTESGIKLITKDAIVKSWNEFFQADNILIASASSQDLNSVKKIFETGLSTLPANGQVDYKIDKEIISDNIKKSQGKIFFFKKNLTQSTIALGTLSEVISYEGNYARTIMNYILGGGSFSSRLVSEIRVKKGMAYSVQSVIRARKKTGVFLAFAQTKTENTQEVIRIIDANIKKISKEPVTKDELNWAIESLTNSFVFKFDSTMSLMGNILELEYTGLPKNYFEKYTDNLKKVNTEKILKESQLLYKNGLVRVVVGNPSLKDELKQFGEVVDLN